MAPWDDWAVPRLVFYGVVVATVAAIVAAGSTSGAAFGIYNPAWDGASDLQAQADAVGTDAEVIRTTAGYNVSTPADTVAIILSPDRPYDRTAAARVEAFVRRGGTLVVGEDYGNDSNALLSAVGASARINGTVLRDERNTYRSPAMPVATNVSSAPLVADVDQLTLNYGTVVVPNDARPIINTSPYGYLDTDGDGNLSTSETLGTYPVVTTESVGAGTVVVVSDASFAINAMIDRRGNKAFTRSLFRGHTRGLLDYSHAESLPPLSLALLIVRESALIQLITGIAVVAGVAVVVGRPEAIAKAKDSLTRSRHSGGDDELSTASDDAMVEYLSTKHPDWERDRLERVVRSLRDDDR